MHPNRLLHLAVLFVAAWACATFPASARASYVVKACNGATGSANRLFSVVSTAPAEHLSAYTECPAGTPNPYDEMRQGIGVFDTVHPGYGANVPKDGRYAEQRFTAPAGTTIAAGTISRDIGNRDRYWRNYGRVDGVDQASETCYAGQGQAFCRITGSKTLSGLSARTIAYGARCDTTWSYCSNGSTLHMVWATILSASITLDDLEPPTVSAPSATGLADGAWHRGAGQITFAASDNTGVRVRRLLEGETVRASETAPGAPSGCADGEGDAFTYAEPCAGDRGLNGTRSIAVTDVCKWGDGEHSIRAAAFDTDFEKAVSSAAVTVRVDCSAPVVSVGPGADREVEAGAEVAPEVSALDPRGVASQEVQYTVGTTGVWRAYTTPIVGVAGSAYRFRVRATDTVGNVSAWSAVSGWTRVKRTISPTPSGPGPQEGGGSAEAPRDVQPSAAGGEAPAIGRPPVAPVNNGGVVAVPPVLDRVALRKPQPTLTQLRQQLDRKLSTLVVTARVSHARRGRVVLTVAAGGKRFRRSATFANGRLKARIRVPRGSKRASVTGFRVVPLR